MRPAEVMVLVVVTVLSVAAGAELVYFALAGWYGPAVWSMCFLILGLVAGRLMWP